MEEIAAFRQTGSDEHKPRVQLLVAADDFPARSQLVSFARDAVGEIAVFEAEDGAEAIQLGLQRRPDIALLDVDMPRLGGIEAAVCLRELRPRIRLALRSGEPVAHREQAHELRLPLFCKQDLDRTLAWLEAQAWSCMETKSEPAVPRKRSFVCGACGYGALRAGAPDRCPMCHAERAWVEAPWRRRGALTAG